jgi:hypothetical protein
VLAAKGRRNRRGGRGRVLATKNTKNTKKEEKILHHLHFYTAIKPNKSPCDWQIGFGIIRAGGQK